MMDCRKVLDQGLLLGLLILRQVLCYPDGAPSQACSNMLPVHGVTASTALCPFTIITSKSTYKPNEEITVTLQANSGQTFKGFFLQPRKMNTINQPNTIGTLTGDSSTWNPCTTGLAALTHTSKSSKTTVIVTWKAPAVADGNVVFLATFVKQTSTYWVNVQSQEIVPDSSVPATNSSVGGGGISTAAPGGVTTAPSGGGTTMSSAGGNVVQCLDPACGKTKGCFHDCNLGDAWTFLVTWADTGGNSIYFEMKAKIPVSNNYWISLGFSFDTKMGEDSVADCSLESGIVKAYSSYNPGKSNELLDNYSYGVIGMGGKLENGVFTCSFSRAKTATIVSSGRRKKRAATSSATFFDLNQDWYLMFALGTGSAVSKRRHTTDPKVSEVKADLQSMLDLTAASNKVSVIKVHGSLMIIGWILLASIGIILPRFYKPVWPKSKLCGEKVWFQIHRACMVLVLFLVAVSFVIIFIHVGVYREIGDTNFQKAHPILGIIIIALTLINPVMALFRPLPDAQNRKIFNIAHRGVGTSSHILSVINIFIGVSLSPSDMSKKVEYVLWAYVGWWIALMIFLEVHDFIQCKKVKEEDSFKLRNIAEAQPSGGKPLNAHKWKPWILAVHVVIILGLTVALLILGNLKKNYVD